MVLKRTYAYREFNQGFGLISEETVDMTPSEAINSLWEKYGDTLWNSITNEDWGMRIIIPDLTKTNGTEYEYLLYN